MKLDKIKNLESLLNLVPGDKIREYQIKPLTAPGENYGSVMLSVDVVIETQHGKDEIFAVVKLVPPSEFLQELFNIQVAFRNEVAFYKHIVPLLQEFQKEHGVVKVVDFAPKYYGSRLNLTGERKVDLDAALVLENLKAENYVALERTKGVDLDIAKLVITDLAYFHAVPLAFRLQKPDVFEREIKPFLSTWLPLEESHNSMKIQLDTIIDEIDEVKEFKERILRGFDMELVSHDPGDLFATITHNDCWINNNMVKFDGTKPVKNKLVDYQVCDYGSPARDIVFFLFSSVQSDVIKKHFDFLIEWYHHTFVSILEDLKCDPSAFTLPALVKELDFEARNSEFAHIIFMLFPIFATKKNVKDISEVTAESLAACEVTEEFKRKLIFVVDEFAKRNWI